MCKCSYVFGEGRFIYIYSSFRILVCRADDRAGVVYQDRLLRAWFRGGRKICRSGRTFHSGEQFKEELRTYRSSDLHRLSEQALFELMKESGCYESMMSIRARRGSGGELDGEVDTTCTPAEDGSDAEDELEEASDAEEDEDEDLKELLVEMEEQEVLDRKKKVTSLLLLKRAEVDPVVISNGDGDIPTYVKNMAGADDMYVGDREVSFYSFLLLVTKLTLYGAVVKGNR